MAKHPSKTRRIVRRKKRSKSVSHAKSRSHAARAPETSVEKKVTSSAEDLALANWLPLITAAKLWGRNLRSAQTMMQTLTKRQSVT